MKTGLCLYGGGVKGAAHIGALKAFQEYNIKFDLISGTSSGSIIATLYALGYSPDEMLNIFKNYCKKIKYIDFYTIFKLIKDFVLCGKISITGLNSGIMIQKLINKFASKKNISNINQINIPLFIPSIDSKTGSIIIFTSKILRNTFSDKTILIDDINLGTAVRASCSFPGIFSPVTYKNFLLIDGGIRENTPWKILKQMGAENIFNIVFEKNVLEKNCCNNIVDIVHTSIDILCHELSTYELYGATNIIKINSSNISLLDYSKIDFLYELGYKSTKKMLKKHVHKYPNF